MRESAPTCGLQTTVADGEVLVTDQEWTERPGIMAASADRVPDHLLVAATAVAAVAVGLLDVDAAGLALHGPDGTVIRLSATSGLIGRLDRVQADLEQGPGRARFDVGSERFVADAGVDLRYPEWSQAAARLGMLSIHMTALSPFRDHGVSLDLYSHRPHGIGSATVAAVAALALPAALDLGNAARARELQDALVERETIGQAQGILMERHGWSAPQALAELRRRSRVAGSPVRDQARGVVADADAHLDGDPRPS